MDLRNAVNIILAAAGMLGATAASAPAASFDKGEVTQAGSEVTANKKLNAAIHLILMKYGILPGTLTTPKRAEAIKLAADLRAALKLVDTPAGRTYAAQKGLTAAKIDQVKASLAKFDKAREAERNRK